MKPRQMILMAVAAALAAVAVAQMAPPPGAGALPDPPKEEGCRMCAMHKEASAAMEKMAALLDKASKALAADRNEEASQAIADAQKLLAEQKQAMQKKMAEHMKADHTDAGEVGGATAQVVNARCPIMGNALDKDKVPARLTRMFEGQRVGFCCAGCPVAWDKLPDDEKRDKLSKAMAAPEQRPEK